MKIKRIFAATLALISALFTTPSFAEEKDISQMSAMEIVSDINIGWNLGNSLESVGIPYTTPENAEKSWGNPVTTKETISTVKVAGFNAVRIPVTWFDKCDDNGTIDQAWLKRVKEVVDYAYSQDMYVILNMHHEVHTNNNALVGWLIPTSAQKENCIKKVDSQWTQIANYFKDYDRHLIFETLNEPREIGGVNEWNGGTQEVKEVINALNQEAVNVIRSTGGNNETRLIMCPPNAASIAGLDGYVLPTDPKSNIMGSNIAVSVHNYSPYSFALDKNGTSSWGSDADKQDLNSELKYLYDNYVSSGIPVIMGEMGALYKSGNTNNDADRITWANYYITRAKAYNIPCFIWDNNLKSSGETFMLLNRATLTWEFPELVTAFVTAANSEITPDLEPINTDTSLTEDAYTKILYRSSDALSDYDSSQGIELTEDVIDLINSCEYIAIEYEGSAPRLAFNAYSEASDWTFLLPSQAEKTGSNVVYYKKDTILSVISSAQTVKTLQGYDTILAQANGSTTTVKAIAVILPHLEGDVTSNGEVTTEDTTRILKDITTASSLTQTEKVYADVYKDDTINLLDVIKLLIDL
ncbi:MAG: cellulase family glycosylhydrolase [Firmicutes bacterium]|nr:cellulase family glycosylhydrolase [Bacillota bacterium]